MALKIAHADWILEDRKRCKKNSWIVRYISRDGRRNEGECKGNWYTLMGGNYFKMVWISYKKLSTLKGKNLNAIEMFWT